MEIIEEKKPAARPVVEKEEIANRIIERKLRLLENPSSMVIAPRTREGHLMTKILFGFDKAVNQVRLKAATYIPIKDVTASLKDVENFISRFEAAVRSLGDDNYSGYADNNLYRGRENPETKKALAERRTTYVFLARTEEGREIAVMLKRFDPLLLKFRATCTDFTKSKKVFDAVIDAIKDFNSLTVSLSSLAKVQYRIPERLSAITNNSAEKQPES